MEGIHDAFSLVAPPRLPATRVWRWSAVMVFQVFGWYELRSYRGLLRTASARVHWNPGRLIAAIATRLMRGPKALLESNISSMTQAQLL